MKILPNEYICRKKNLIKKQYDVLEVSNSFEKCKIYLSFKILNETKEEVWVKDWDCIEIPMADRLQYCGFDKYNKDIYDKKPWLTMFLPKDAKRKHFKVIKDLITGASIDQLNIIYSDINYQIATTSRALLKSMYVYYLRVKIEILNEFKHRDFKIPKFKDRIGYYFYPMLAKF